MPRGRRALVHTDAGRETSSRARRPAADWLALPGIGDPAEDLYGFLSPAFQIISRAHCSAPTITAASCGTMAMR